MIVAVEIANNCCDAVTVSASLGLTAKKRCGRRRAIRNHLVILINKGCFVGLEFSFLDWAHCAQRIVPSDMWTSDCVETSQLGIEILVKRQCSPF